MDDLNTRIEDLFFRLEKIKNSFDLNKKKKELDDLTTKSQNPNLWSDQDSAKFVMQSISELEKDIFEIEDLSSTIDILKEIPEEKEVLRLEKIIGKLELKAFLSGLYDDKSAIVSIHAGQGGTEAMDWSEMVFRMYTRYAEKRGWDLSVIDSTDGEEAGIKSITFNINGSYAYGYLKNESGTHRLVRQSPFNADNLRQTSFCLVEVMPQLSETDLPDIKIPENDLDWQFTRAGGHGGQNVNKVSTAVRLTHIPTGIVITARTERFQEQNRKIALGLLRSKLWIRQTEIEKNKLKDIKGEYRPASWGNQIRSYVLHPYKMVKDLRTSIESKNPSDVLDGNLDEFIEAELKLKT